MSLKLQPVANGMEKNWAYNFMQQAMADPSRGEDFTEQKYWDTLHSRTVDRFKVRNPDSKFDIASAVTEVHENYRQREGIRIRKHY